MGNTIQHYVLRDMSLYGNSIKLNTSMEKLNEMQTEERKGSFAVAENCAATVEISEMAKAMYESLTEVPKQKVSDVYAGTYDKVSDKQEKAVMSVDKTKYEDLSGVEREIKELEDYIASHPVDTSIDLLRNGSLSKLAGSDHVVDLSQIQAENEDTEAFMPASEEKKDSLLK